MTSLKVSSATKPCGTAKPAGSVGNSVPLGADAAGAGAGAAGAAAGAGAAAAALPSGAGAAEATWRRDLASDGFAHTASRAAPRAEARVARRVLVMAPFTVAFIVRERGREGWNGKCALGQPVRRSRKTRARGQRQREAAQMVAPAL